MVLPVCRTGWCEVRDCFRAAAAEQLLLTDGATGIDALVVLFIPEKVARYGIVRGLYSQRSQFICRSIPLAFTFAHATRVFGAFACATLDLAGQFDVDAGWPAILAKNGIDQFANLEEGLAHQGIGDFRRLWEKLLLVDNQLMWLQITGALKRARLARRSR